jgi:hypothetical protein
MGQRMLPASHARSPSFDEEFVPHLLVNIIGVLVMLAPVFIAAWLAWKFFRLKARRHGHCPHCGYSRKGADGTQCPECGKSTQWEHTTQFSSSGEGSGGGGESHIPPPGVDV